MHRVIRRKEGRCFGISFLKQGFRLLWIPTLRPLSALSPYLFSCPAEQHTAAALAPAVVPYSSYRFNFFYPCKLGSKWSYEIVGRGRTNNWETIFVPIEFQIKFFINLSIAIRIYWVSYVSCLLSWLAFISRLAFTRNLFTSTQAVHIFI